MTDKTRIKIAAVLTILFLAGISAAGLASRGHKPAAPGATVTQPVGVPGESASTEAARSDDHKSDDDGHDDDHGDRDQHKDHDHDD